MMNGRTGPNNKKIMSMPDTHFAFKQEQPSVKTFALWLILAKIIVALREKRTYKWFQVKAKLQET